MHKTWQQWLKLFVVAFFIAISSSAWGQMITQKGVVIDQAGEPIIGATIMVKGTKDGVATDIDGNFTLNCKSGSILQISSIGFKPAEVKATGSDLEVTMVENSEVLDEVVVVGYGTMNKKHVTGAMTSIDQTRLEQKNATSVLDALQGSVPGMQITSTSGAPGQSSFVTMRGASTFSDGAVSPLFVVDGVVVDDIDNISPSDIKQIDVMKDAASASIYGARAANGVIFITTKFGEAGKTNVSVRYQHSWSSVANKLPQLNAFESRLSLDATKFTPANTLEKFNNRTDSVGLLYTTNYYYQDLLFRTANRDEMNAQISGGNSNYTYRVSLNYVGQEGVMLTSFNDVYTANANFDYNPWKNVRLSTRVRLSYNKRNNIRGAVLQDAMRRDANLIIWYPDGELIPYSSSGGRRNPIAELEQRKNETTRYNGVFYQSVAWTIAPYLRLEGNISANFNTSRNVQFVSKNLDGNSKNSGSDQTVNTWKYSGEAFATFNKNFGEDHSLTAVLGTSFETSNAYTSNIAGSEYLSETLHWMNMATVYNLNNVYTNGWEESLASFFGRAVYSFKNRYTLTAVVRRDGSSRFGSNNRWGTFPSVSAGWRFSDESFMRWATPALTDAKLRVSWGKTGNDKIGRYESKTVYTDNGSYNGVGAIVPSTKYGNPNLKWEETTSTNLGLDLAFFNGRLTFAGDYYIKKTTDLLADQNLPYTTGYNNIRVNLAGIENKGVELSVTAIPVANRNFNWTTTLTWWKNNNTITSLAREDYVHNSTWYVAEGKPAGLWYGYKNLGVYQYDASNAYAEDYHTRLTPVFERDEYDNVIIGLNGQPTLIEYRNPDGTVYEGEVKRLKANGVVAGGGDVIWQNMPDANGVYDDEINTNDQMILGNANPKWFSSWYNSVSYKNFSLSFSFYLSWGGKIYNDNKRYYTSWGGNTHRQSPEYILQGWKYPGEITTWYALDTKSRKTNNQSMALNSQFLENGTFLRLQSLRFTYTLEKKWIKKTPFSNIQAYLYGNNLMTWTNYTGFDPEIGGSVLAPGKDSSIYPHNRELGCGINVNF